MMIFVSLVPKKLIQLNVKPKDTIEKIKEKLLAKEGLDPLYQQLVHQKRELKNHRTLEYYEIKDGMTINVYTKHGPKIESLELLARTTSLEAKWSQSEGKFSGYNITLASSDGKQNITGPLHKNADSKSHTFLGLRELTTYTVKLRTTVSDGRKGIVTRKTITTAPVCPSIDIKVQHNTITVTWNKPQNTSFKGFDICLSKTAGKGVDKVVSKVALQDWQESKRVFEDLQPHTKHTISFCLVKDERVKSDEVSKQVTTGDVPDQQLKPVVPKPVKKKIFQVVKFEDFIVPACKDKPWTEEVLKEIRKRRRVISELADPKRIEDDLRDLNSMVLAAKISNWDQVFSVLDRKKYLINGIPEERAWSALHQAVFHNDVRAVERLLAFENCDLEVKAKRDRGNQAEAGDTPFDLATRHGRADIATILCHEHRNKGTHDIPPTFVDQALGEKYVTEGIPLFMLSISFLRKSLVEEMKVDEVESFIELMSTLYNTLKNNWQELRNAICECLRPFNIKIADDLKKTITYEKFLEYLIEIYTKDAVYRQVNKGLRHASKALDPSGDDMLLCLYTLMLEVVLLKWDVLPKYSGMSYRGVTLNKEELHSYKKDVVFVWLSFTSSSKSEAVSFPGNVKFIIDNQVQGEWQPRDVSSYSCFNEQEVLYPAGAEFKVTAVHKNSSKTKIYLQLLNPMTLQEDEDC